MVTLRLSGFCRCGQDSRGGNHVNIQLQSDCPGHRGHVWTDRYSHAYGHCSGCKQHFPEFFGASLQSQHI
ncbi:hypothetical protein DPMN_104347 [Dreissena polymorpha]|uniref:Uncharacterized protein n=1 Tax=Dreissena polymorpha TaxID=45954 RepID=A0A9D4HCW7_DREPO|nr:hypothetical protein DPMN_104347 [Dreissena polymorpha]